MTLGLDFDKHFLNNHITTVIAYHTNKHQNYYISRFVFGRPLVNITYSKWQPVQNQSKYTNLKGFKIATSDKIMEFVESFCHKKFTIMKMHFFLSLHLPKIEVL